MTAKLVLEDGRVFHGEAFGVSGTRFGEVCFNTSMTGYQEVLTDPSYRGQIVAMTYPLIGNYGVNELDTESNEPHVRGFVIEELCDIPSNWRAESSLEDYFKKWKIVGIQGVDTRALTKHLRNRGAMKAILTTETITDEDAAEQAKASDGTVGMDFVQEVSQPNYTWDPESIDSRCWVQRDPRLLDQHEAASETSDVFESLPPVNYNIVAYDFGIKRNILRRLRQNGFGVEVVNASTPASEVLARNPDGIFLSNGPGDPSALDHIHREVAQLMGKKPIFAICLGHQILGHAFGGKTFKLKFGHRGGNQPVKDLRDGTIAITSQNHGYAVDAESLPSNVEVTHINLNDDTVEGLRHTEMPIFSVQYHPEAAPGPHDAKYFFQEFANLIDQARD
ncbi:MAG: carbamoyl-phosphate synthase small subunit [Verrucomicrobiales bacterium]|jgi:carbamoyl-phosphate synthase small subunit